MDEDVEGDTCAPKPRKAHMPATPGNPSLDPIAAPGNKVYIAHFITTIKGVARSVRHYTCSRALIAAVPTIDSTACFHPLFDNFQGLLLAMPDGVPIDEVRLGN